VGDSLDSTGIHGLHYPDEHMRQYSLSLTLAATAAALLATDAHAQAGRGATAQQQARAGAQANQPWQCAPTDAARAFQRSVRIDSLRAGQRSVAPPSGTTPVTGGTQRSQQFPEFDVVLDVPNLCVNRVFLKVDSLSAKLSLDARVSNLVRVNAGADVFIGNVDLTIEGVRAQALLLVDLDDVVYIVDQTLTFVDNNPQVIDKLGSTLQNVGGSVGGLVGNTLGGLILTTRNLADGNVLQRVVNNATGEILERTVGAAGSLVGQRVVGNLLRMNVLRETQNAAGDVVRQVRDESGKVLEYTLNRATNAISGLRILP
jgi:hypothetical protein